MDDQLPKFNEPAPGSIGPMIGSVLVIIVLIIGAIYFWGNKLSETKSKPTALPSLSQSDEYDALQNDIDNTPSAQIDTNF